MSAQSAAAAAAAAAADDAKSRNKVPMPTWIPLNRAASLGSWRSGPGDAPASLRDGRPDTAPKELYFVRCANVSEALVTAVASAVDAAAIVYSLPPPRTMQKLKSDAPTPQAGAAAAPDSPPPLDEDEGAGMPAMTLGPSMPQSVLDSAALVVAALRDNVTAEAVAAKLKPHDGAVVDVVQRPVPASSTVVIKGVPLSVKHDRLWSELLQFSCVPTYIRFHRNDRGLFKNAVYVKYPSRFLAERGRQELERFTVAGRLLKVELKRPKQASVEESARAEAARREDLKVLVLSSFDDRVAELMKSTDNEGFSYGKNILTRDEVRYLKGLCQAHDLIFETPASAVCVKKRVDKKSVSPSMSAKTPPFHPTTPSLHAADAADAAGLQFRGIRHWREMRSQQQQLGIHRALGPGDVAPFGPGRGRPARD